MTTVLPENPAGLMFTPVYASAKVCLGSIPDAFRIILFSCDRRSWRSTILTRTGLRPELQAVSQIHGFQIPYLKMVPRI